MPKNRLQKTVFAFLAVLVMVHAYVFYSIFVIHGDRFMEHVSGAAGVLDAVRKMGGVPMFGTNLPIWAVIAVEFICAFGLELLVGSPLSFKVVCKNFDPKETSPVLFESAIICATVGIMCPTMSFLAAIFYYPFAYQAFHIWTLLTNWLELVCFNFPFAFFTQLFFIQPLIRTVFRRLFRKDIAAQGRS